MTIEDIKAGDIALINYKGEERLCIKIGDTLVSLNKGGISPDLWGRGKILKVYDMSNSLELNAGLTFWLDLTEGEKRLLEKGAKLIYDTSKRKMTLKDVEEVLGYEIELIS